MIHISIHRDSRRWLSVVSFARVPLCQKNVISVYYFIHATSSPRYLRCPSFHLLLVDLNVATCAHYEENLEWTRTCQLMLIE